MKIFRKKKHVFNYTFQPYKPKNRLQQLISINKALFEQLLVSYLLLLLIEEIWPKSVTPYLNMNILLILVIITGAIAVLTQKEEQKIISEPARKDYLLIGILGIAGAGIIFYKTKEIGWLSYIISAISGILIILLSCLVINEEE